MRRNISVAAILVAALMVVGSAGILLQAPNSSEQNDDGSTAGLPNVADKADDIAPAAGPVAEQVDVMTPVPPTACKPVPNPCKDEPLVETALSGPLVTYMGHPAPNYGEPAWGQVSTWVKDQADATHIAVVIYFVGLSNDEVYVNTTTSNGGQHWTNLVNDGDRGCYGMLMDDPATINNKMGWTWMYSGSRATEYHNISFTATFYKLGSFEVKIYACDQDTGKRISDADSYDFSVYGNGGKFGFGLYMFDNHGSYEGEFRFVPGEKYNFTFTDTCRYTRYSGTVMSVLTIPYIEAAWMKSSDGTLTLLEKDPNGFYSWTWCYCGGSHVSELVIQFGVAGGGPYNYSSGDYFVVDVESGMSMSLVNGLSHSGIQYFIRSL